VLINVDDNFNTVVLVQILVPGVLDQGIQADAIAYFGNISAAAPFGTEVFRFRLVIDLSHFHDDLVGIAIFMNSNNVVLSILKFSDGQNIRQFLIAAQGGIDRVNASRVYPEIRLIDNRMVVYEDSIIYQEIPPASLELPTVLDIELHFIAVGRSYIDIQQLSPFAVGRVTLTPLPPGRISLFIIIIILCPHMTHIMCYAIDHPCFEYPCENGGSCGPNANPSCNNGSCMDGANFTCRCVPGFTGDTCAIDIDECETARCRNGECVDLINTFRCICYDGWTGFLCNTDVDYCRFDSSRFGPCDDFGTRACVDGNSTYTCECMDGYAGYDCSLDIDPCDPHPCQNGGNCVNISITTFECTCPEGYTGNACEIDLTPCDPHPCGNGNCTKLDGGVYMCECSPPYSLDARINSCRFYTCPLFTFRNQTTQLCQPCKLT
jgi:hypothetical protein